MKSCRPHSIAVEVQDTSRGEGRVTQDGCDGLHRAKQQERGAASAAGDQGNSVVLLPREGVGFVKRARGRAQITSEQQDSACVRVFK